MAEMTWASVAGHIQNWYEGLLRTTEVYSRPGIPGELAHDTRLAATGVVASARKYSALGFPVIETRDEETLPSQGLGEAADAAYRLIDKTQETLLRFSYEYEDAYWTDDSRDTWGFSDPQAFESAICDINSRLTDLKRYNSEALQLRTQAWRVEMRETVPAQYIDECGFAAVRVQGYAATKAVLGLYRAGVPAEWLGAFMPWDRASSWNVVDRVVQAYNDGIPAEYMAGLL